MSVKDPGVEPPCSYPTPVASDLQPVATKAHFHIVLVTTQTTIPQCKNLFEIVFSFKEQQK